QRGQNVLENVSRLPVADSLLNLRRQVETPSEPARDRVMRQHDLLLETDPQKSDKRGQSQAVGMQKIQSEAIEAQVASAIEHVGVVAQIRRAAAMADDHMLEVDAFGGKDVELLAAHRALVGMRGDRRAGLEMRAGGGAQAFLFVLGDFFL